MTCSYPYEPYSWDLQSPRLGYHHLFVSSGLSLISLDVFIVIVDMWSQGGMPLEDLMKPFWTTLKPLLFMKPTLMKIRRFDGIHVDQGWNVCSPHGYIIKKMYLKFVIHILDLITLIRCIWSLVCLLICWMVFQQVKMSLLIFWNSAKSCSGCLDKLDVAQVWLNQYKNLVISSFL